MPLPPVLFFLAGLPGVCSRRVLLESAQTSPPSLAIIISGIESRFVIRSTLDRVVAPATRAGSTVDLYISLVAAPGHAFHSWQGSPSPRVVEQGNAEKLRANLSKAVARRGGNLALFWSLREQEALDALPTGQVSNLFMSEYSPKHTEIGRNVLRRWKSSRELLKRSMKEYDFVLWQREDQYWTHPFSLAAYDVSPNTIFGKNCLAWGGINDKSMLLGGWAAKELLGNAYHAFWSEDERLVSRNAEQFLKALAEIKNVSIVKVPYRQLPSADATYVPGASPPKLCIKHGKSCERTLPKGEPAFCPDGVNKSSDVEKLLPPVGVKTFSS